MRIIAALSLIAAMSACGQKADLKPAAGKELPVAPYGREERLSAEQLLAPHPQSAPERTVELRSRSVQREDDPFDLPPAE